MKKVLEKTPFAVPIPVVKLTSWLQSKYFKQYEERELLKYVRGIDVNEDETVDAEDLRRFRELISDKMYRTLTSVEI